MRYAIRALRTGQGHCLYPPVAKDERDARFSLSVFGLSVVTFHKRLE
jgi:hypothetical protein